MSKLHIFQFRTRPDLLKNERENFARVFAGTNTELSYTNAFANDVAWDTPEALASGYDGIVLAGSGDFDFDGGREEDDPQRMGAHSVFAQMHGFLDHLFYKDIPTLGICFGHQIMGKFRGADVVYDPHQKKLGSYPVIKNGGSEPLFADTPKEFIAQYGHKDSLNAIPDGATIMAYGDQCTYSALQYSDRIFSVQFHPEMDDKEMAQRLTSSPGYLPEGVWDAAEIISPSPHAESVLTRFNELVRNRAQQ